MNDWNHDESQQQAGEHETHAEQVFGDEAEQATETVDGEVVTEPHTDEERKPFGEDAARFVVDAGYAIAGFAGLVGEKAKAFYDDQKAEYAKTHPEVDAPGARQFLEQLGTHLNKFVDEINKGFRELSEKGRDVVNRRSGETSQPEETTPEQPQDH
ncbi:MAG: hypothetical protein Q4D89_09345 [Arachnia propionica]|uniref:hypothetical protein n=1 Tax=Arachnia propionica TaxID=1750 RepID=UPI00270128B9|nr:hypothetical protein [Arachnia propionica]